MSKNSRRPRLAIGWEAARANLVPGVILQAMMLATVLAYYLSPRAAAGLEHLADLKRAYGFGFTIVASICAGSLLPELFIVGCFQRGRPHAKNFLNLLFTAPFWAVDGVAVDLLYRGQAIWFGTAVTVPVVLTKIAVDQFGYNPLFAAPYGIWGYEWKNRGFTSAALRRLLTWASYRDKVFPALLATWVVWIPLTGMIYSLPLPLQFPLFTLALTFWVLMMTYMTNVFSETEPPSAAAVTVTTPTLPAEAVS